MSGCGGDEPQPPPVTDTSQPYRITSTTKAVAAVSLPWDLAERKALTLLRAATQAKEPIQVRIPLSIDLNERQAILERYPAMEAFVRENFVRVIAREGSSIADVHVTPHGKVRVTWLPPSRSSKVHVAEIGYRSILAIDSAYCEEETCQVWFHWEPAGYLARVILEDERYLGSADLRRTSGRWRVLRMDFDSLGD